jgi:hypothetical protein
MLRVLSILLLSLTVDAYAAESAKPLTITFGPSSVEIGGLTPKATAYVYGLAREPKGWTTSIVAREARLRDDDGDGRVSYQIAGVFPWRSVWLAVELEGGNYGTGAPPAYRVERTALTSTHLKKDATGEVLQLSFDGSLVECIVVRPKGSDVWGATIMSRGALDEGTEVGKVTLSALKLQPRSGTIAAAPKSLKKDDVIFVLNSFRGAYGVARVGE